MYTLKKYDIRNIIFYENSKIILRVYEIMILKLGSYSNCINSYLVKYIL